MTEHPYADDKRRLPELLHDAMTRAEELDALLDDIIAVAVPNGGPDQVTLDMLSDISEQIFWSHMQLDQLMIDPNPQNTEPA